MCGLSTILLISHLLISVVIQFSQLARHIMGNLAIVYISFVIFLCCQISVTAQVFDVINYGAIGDGKNDDTQAFLKAWEDTCAVKGANPTLIIPADKTFLLKAITFSGTCNSPSINIKVLGDIHAPNGTTWIEKTGSWISFRQINGLTIDGTGTIDGMGEVWWDQSCKRKPGPKCSREKAPTQISITECNNLSLRDFKLVNGQRNHLAITKSKGLTISGLTITAAGDSPNTDGIDIGRSDNVTIQDCTIGTGDDCIALGNGTSNVNITRVACGPGHGISIGSLGRKGVRAMVEQIHVQHCSFTNTQNGARIKTWQGGSGYARGITFNNITLTSAANPIVIDQFYCPDHEDCGSSDSAVEVSDVRFTGVKGTVQLHGSSNTEIGVKLNCSALVPCKNIIVDDVKITSVDPKVQVTSLCSNARVINTCPDCAPKLNCTFGASSDNFLQMPRSPAISDDDDDDDDYEHMEL